MTERCDTPRACAEEVLREILAAQGVIVPVHNDEFLGAMWVRDRVEKALALLSESEALKASYYEGYGDALKDGGVQSAVAASFMPWDLETVKQEIRDLFARYGSGDYTPSEEEKEIIENALDEILTPPPVAQSATAPRTREECDRRIDELHEEIKRVAWIREGSPRTTDSRSAK